MASLEIKLEVRGWFHIDRAGSALNGGDDDAKASGMSNARVHTTTSAHRQIRPADSVQNPDRLLLREIPLLEGKE